MSTDRAMRAPDEPGGAADGDATARTLRERARRLALPPDAPAAGARVEVLVVRLRDEQYAIEARLLRSVHRVTGLTPLPCVPPFVAGLVNIRGDVITVLDLGVALGLPADPPAGDDPGPSAPATVLLAECPHGRVGLAVDEVLGLRPLALAALAAPLAGQHPGRGIADARIAFLDLEQFLCSGRLDVFEDVR